MLGQWKVNVIGDRSKGEIAIVREGFELGLKTHGYLGHKKLLVLHCTETIPDEVWKYGVMLADKMARERNAAEQEGKGLEGFTPETLDQIAMAKLVTSSPDELEKDMVFWREYWHTKHVDKK